MQNIIEAFRQSLASAYQQAIECDKFLEEIKTEGHGKFEAVFAKGFETKADRFLPYVEEVGKTFYELTENNQNRLDQQSITELVKKLEQLFLVQAQFMQAFNNADKMH